MKALADAVCRVLDEFNDGDLTVNWAAFQIGQLTGRNVSGEAVRAAAHTYEWRRHVLADPYAHTSPGDEPEWAQAEAAARTADADLYAALTRLGVTP